MKFLLWWSAKGGKVRGGGGSKVSGAHEACSPSFAFEVVHIQHKWSNWQ